MTQEVIVLVFVFPYHYHISKLSKEIFYYSICVYPLSGSKDSIVSFFYKQFLRGKTCFINRAFPNSFGPFGNDFGSNTLAM